MNNALVDTTMQEQVTPEQEAQTRKLLTPRLRQRVETRVRELLDKSAEIWPQHKAKFQDAPTVRFDVKNRWGGVAISGGSDDWTVRLNLILCYENEDDFIQQTVGHEVAHLVCHVVHGFTKRVEENGETKIKKIRAHGPEWRDTMVQLGLKPATYHKYDTSSIETKKRKRAKRGAVITVDDIAHMNDMMRRLQTGIKRLPKQMREELISWIEDYNEMGEGGEGESQD